MSCTGFESFDDPLLSSPFVRGRRVKRDVPRPLSPYEGEGSQQDVAVPDRRC